MITINNIYNTINSLAPFRYAESWDNVGLLIGDGETEVTRAIICLDVTDKVIDEAISQKANLIITHHPVIFHAIKSIKGKSNIHKLIRNDIAVISAHTNLDIADGFVNDVLVKKLGLIDIEHLEEISARSDKGETLSLGRIGNLTNDIDTLAFAQLIKDVLKADKIEFVGQGNIKRIAACGGSGASLMATAIAKGADALVTADVDHDKFLLAEELGIALFDAGHYHTEVVVLEKLRDILAKEISEVEFIITKQGHITTTI